MQKIKPSLKHKTFNNRGEDRVCTGKTLVEDYKAFFQLTQCCVLAASET